MDDVAEFFGIGVASLNRWLRLERETGDLQPRPKAGGNKSPIDDDGEKFLKRYIKTHVDVSLKELVKLLEEKVNIKTSKSAVSRALARMGITRKKKHSMPKNATRTV